MKLPEAFTTYTRSLLGDTDYDAFFFTSAATTRNLKFGQRGNPLQFGVDVSLHF